MTSLRLREVQHASLSGCNTVREVTDLIGQRG